MTRAEPQQERSRATVERILAAADQAFAVGGSANVTTTQIAESAGLSVGALYRFFPDKHAIGVALADRYLADAVERFEPLLRSITRLDDVPDGLRPVIAAAAELALAHPGYYQLTREVAPADAGSAGRLVRSAMVDAFDDLLVRLGSPARDDRRRRAVTLVIETVRHTLATCPREEPERSLVVAELTQMIVTYAASRLVRPPSP